MAVSSEGLNAESLAQTEEIIDAGKHAFYDKPAGDDYPRFQRVVAKARERGLLIQLGYMFRYHDGFSRIAEWARSGFLGHVFAIRAHMSTTIDEEAHHRLSVHPGGVFYDLAGHVWTRSCGLWGKPDRVHVLHAPRRVDRRGVHRQRAGCVRVRVGYGDDRHSGNGAEPDGAPLRGVRRPGLGHHGAVRAADTLRLCLAEPSGSFPAGVSTIKLEDRRRYVASLEAFVKDLRGEKQPDRSLDHELLVQETPAARHGKDTVVKPCKVLDLCGIISAT